MARTAFIFPGQGSQSVGMMSALADEYPQIVETFAQASEVLGYDLWDVCQNGPEARLNQTEVTQPAMLAAGVATWRAWCAQSGPRPDFMAGHSLGEYSALVAAGTMQFKDAVSTVALRGRLMQAATPAGVGAMAAILGLDDEQVSAICQQVAGDEVVSCANFNSPGQVVIAGHAAAVARACEACREAGARRALVLPVSVPSHCLLMKPAADALAGTIAALQFEAGGIPVLQNADVIIHEPLADIKDGLVRQMWQPVRWTESIRYLASLGVCRFVECGPGKVLAGLNRRIERDAGIFALTDAESFKTALES